MVLEEILRTEGIPYARLHGLNQLEKSDLKGLILGEGFDDAERRDREVFGSRWSRLVLKPSGRLAEALGLKQLAREGRLSDGTRQGRRNWSRMRAACNSSAYRIAMRVARIWHRLARQKVLAGSFASNAVREARLPWHSTWRPPC